MKFRSVLLLSACAVAALAEPAVSASLWRTDTGTAISPEAVGPALTRSGILVRFEPGDELAVLGLRLRATTPSAAYLGASSEYLAAAVLAGQVVGEGIAAEPGEALVQQIGDSSLERFAYDVDRFLASSSLLIDHDLQAGLEQARTRQAERIWWGLLEPTGFNAQAPVPPAVEAARRDYLLRPAVIAVRQQASGDPAAMSRLVAERFVAAVGARDDATARDLLAPSLFFEGGRGQTEWLTLRAGFARELVNSDLARRLQGAQITEGDLAGGFALRAATGESFRLEQAAFDDMVFVTSLRPQ